MTFMQKRFNDFKDEYLKFERIENPPSLRRDLCAFIMLDKLFPSKLDIIVAAEHDEIWLDIKYEDIESLTDDNIIYLLRCGVLYDADNSSLSMNA